MKSSEIKVIFQLLVLVAINTIPSEIQGQSIKRQAISCYGGSSVVNDIYMSFTAGQSFNTSSRSDDGLAFLKGFQQPVTFAIIQEENLEDELLQLSIYPNPATYSVTIESASAINELKIRIYDITGKAMYMNEVHNFRKLSVSCGSWTNGVYVIQAIDASDHNKIIKLIINK
jgi:hypothetical protein